MTFWKALDTTRRYQVFFGLTAVLPILMFSVHLLGNVYMKANDAVTVMLESGLQYVEDAVQANLHELRMSARQAALLSLNDSFHEYLRSGDETRFKTYLERYRSTNAHDVVLVLSPSRRIMMNVSGTHPFNLRSFNKLLDEALKGQATMGFERFRSEADGGLHLAYVAASPIPRSYNEAPIDGVLVIGRYVKNDNAYSSLQRIMPQHLFRVIVRTPQEYQLEVSGDNNVSERLMTSAVLTRLHALEPSSNPSVAKRAAEDSGIDLAFQERLLGKAYMTRLFPLNNQYAMTAGYIAISVPVAELKDFTKENLGFIALFIGMLLVWVFLAGRWFRQDVVDPMDALTEGLKEVAHGNLAVRLPVRAGYHQEARETIASFNHLVRLLEENEQLRSTFISTLSHDLRTPLQAQQRGTALLEENLDLSGEPRLRSILAGLRQSNDDLLAMVVTLLENYQYEDGQIVLDLAPVSVKALVEQTFETVRPLAEEARITLENCIGDLPEIMADALQLKRVFLNLVTNAIQNISENSRVWVEATVDPETLHIRIADNGPGLSDKVRKRLFMRYNTGPRLTKRIGSGLGLFICRMIVELHHGAIEAESAPGEGTCFHIRLPRQVKDS